MKQEVITRRGVKTIDLNPRRAIRRHCHMCSDYDWEKVEACSEVECELHAFRIGNAFGDDLNSEFRRKAIRRYCRNRCSGGDEKQYQNCDMPLCPLFFYRLQNRTLKAAVRIG